MSVRTLITDHLRAAEAEGRTLSDSEAALIEQIAASAADVPAPVTAPVPIYTAPRIEAAGGFTVDQVETLVGAIREGRSMSVQAAASLYDTVKPMGPSTRIGQTNSLVRYFQTQGAGFLNETSRKIGHVQTTEAMLAADWVAGQTKKEIPVAWVESPTHTAAAYTLLYEPNTLDVAGLTATIGGLLERAVVARENRAIAGDIDSAAQSAGVNASAIGAAADAMTTVIENGGTPGMFLVSTDAYAQLISSATFGNAAEVGTSVLFGLPLVGVGGLGAGTVIAADPRSIGLAYLSPVAYVGQNDATRNEMIVRVESNLTTIVFDPFSIAKSVID